MQLHANYQLPRDKRKKRRKKGRPRGTNKKKKNRKKRVAATSTLSPGIEDVNPGRYFFSLPIFLPRRDFMATRSRPSVGRANFFARFTSGDPADYNGCSPATPWATPGTAFNKVRVNADGGWQVPFLSRSGWKQLQKASRRANTAVFFSFFRKTFNAIHGVLGKKKRERKKKKFV
jgi:hypothetical protein